MKPNNQVEIPDYLVDKFNPKEQDKLHVRLVPDDIQYWELILRVHNCILCGFPNLIGVVTVDREISGSTEKYTEQTCSLCGEIISNNGGLLDSELI